MLKVVSPPKMYYLREKTHFHERRFEELKAKFSELSLSTHSLKYISLFVLTFQNAILGLSMRYSRTKPGDRYYTSTVVFIAEILKLVACLILILFEEGSFSKTKASLHNAIIKNKSDTIKMFVPSCVYVLQNNLLFISASHLDAATYQVTYQLKIFTTAIFAIIMLKKKLFFTQWGALVFLVAGVALVQLAQGGESHAVTSVGDQNKVLGFLTALGACVLSGFAGIFFEKMLKTSDLSVWMRNVQLSLLGLPLSLITCYINDGDKIRETAFFHGYDAFVLFVILQQAGGGLLVAVVVKYADNILKGFATSLSIVMCCICSIYIFDFQLTLQFVFGATFVIFSIFLYSIDFSKPKPDSPKNLREELMSENEPVLTKTDLV